MNKLRVLTIVAMAVGCSVSNNGPGTNPEDDSGAGDASVINAGYATDVVRLSELSYELTVEGTGDGESVRYGKDLCEHARLRGTTVIAEIQPGVQYHPSVPVCESSYADDAVGLTIKILANVAGEAVPSELDTTLVFLGWNTGEWYEGQTVLLTMREDQGEWLWLGWVPVTLNPGGTGVEPPTVGDLPTTFAELTSKLTELNTDPLAKCGGEGPEEKWGWPDYVRDPAVWYESCRPGYVQPDAGGYPSRDTE